MIGELSWRVLGKVFVDEYLSLLRQWSDWQGVMACTSVLQVHSLTMHAWKSLGHEQPCMVARHGVAWPAT